MNEITVYYEGVGQLRTNKAAARQGLIVQCI